MNVNLSHTVQFDSRYLQLFRIIADLRGNINIIFILKKESITITIIIIINFSNEYLISSHLCEGFKQISFFFSTILELV